jgi:hypothetical protein
MYIYITYIYAGYLGAGQWSGCVICRLYHRASRAARGKGLGQVLSLLALLYISTNTDT